MAKIVAQFNERKHKVFGMFVKSFFTPGQKRPEMVLKGILAKDFDKNTEVS